MRNAYVASAVYAAEAQLMETVPEGSLMATASAGLATVVRDLLSTERGVVGSRIVLLVGAGNNGGDALYAGAALARSGAAVTALTTADRWHEGGAQAVLAAGGRLQAATTPSAGKVIGQADVVVDGIVGIGATGPVRSPAAELLDHIPDSAWVVAVDIPSGVDPSTGEVPGAAVSADVTVTFGVLKAGQVLPPGRDHCGAVELVDIGLADAAAQQPVAFSVLSIADAEPYVRAPGSDDYKYSHGVLGVVAGCAQYPGAPHMVVGAGRHSGVGMVRLFQDPIAPQVAAAVVDRFPDTVCTDVITDAKVTGWTIGPGMGTTDAARERLVEVLASDLPVVVDADALTLVAHDADLRAAVGKRSAPTVLTPHVGEFARLGFEVGDDRVAAAVGAADALGVTMLLKGPGTVIADPDGNVFVDVIGTSALATAGSGDSLSGIIGAVLSRHPEGRPGGTAAAVAAAVVVHGLAGRIGSAGGLPMTAWDLVGAVPGAVASIRRG